ncbi:FumA C-terminus/TtdB family hydratase beta subunit [Thermoproteus tenax]|uniref:Fumarate hydratase class I, C-terminal domain / tartrate dehydratase beta subunit n=2 Tax=Thermoproteus tenax TaxID=2271 RepID=G4RLD9_THETK|nr:FumA C-terminus/TtdB family hydratase beta subunit [Thermoproteus tenax]CAF18496.1 tartrate dehydratase beta subunit/fumarate hydratase class I, C-terminal domain [Thermoproteus tenax]CCC82384.1 fumarate hydratase class I, C-terminal domain / tartrate dehydratase beta subunit [Thermoproteus tenax Kra 1]
MATYRLRTPLSDDDVGRLRVGDTLYISGVIVSARDAAHARMLEHLREGKQLPVDLRGGVIYHAGPVAKKEEDRWRIIAMGPTTSARMEAFEAEVIERLGVKLIVGKGGMGKRTAEAMKKYKAAYAIFTGGAGVLAAQAIRRVVDVHWLDLGMAEAMWVLEVEDFGPLTVMIDPTGYNYYEEARQRARERIPEIVREVGELFR